MQACLCSIKNVYFRIDTFKFIQKAGEAGLKFIRVCLNTYRNPV